MPLRVLLVCQFHPELVPGGAQQVTYDLFQELRERNDIECFLLASLDETYPALFKSGARITGFDGRRDEYLFLSRDYDSWWHKLGEPLLVESFIEFLQTIRPDVVHFHHFVAFGIDLLSVVRRVLPACRIVFTLHEFMAICAADGHMVRRTDALAVRSRHPGALPPVLPRSRAGGVPAAQDVVHAPPRAGRLLRLPQPLHDRALRDLGHRARQDSPRNQRPASPHRRRRRAPTAAGPRNRFGFFGQLNDNKGPHILLRAVNLLRADGFSRFHVETQRRQPAVCLGRGARGGRSGSWPPRSSVRRPNGW